MIAQSYISRCNYFRTPLGAECRLNEDILRIAEILDRYADSRIDFVDASVMAVAERLNIVTVLTLDRRDFSLFRPRHCDGFVLIP
jgi:uncharacterized protein